MCVLGGIMMRRERLESGIYMVSNMANTCAVWNCKVRDYDGSIIGMHGDIERLRPVLGSRSLLDAGQLQRLLLVFRMRVCMYTNRYIFYLFNTDDLNHANKIFNLS